MHLILVVLHTDLLLTHPLQVKQCVRALLASDMFWKGLGCRGNSWMRGDDVYNDVEWAEFIGLCKGKLAEIGDDHKVGLVASCRVRSGAALTRTVDFCERTNTDDAPWMGTHTLHIHDMLGKRTVVHHTICLFVSLKTTALRITCPTAVHHVATAK